MARNTSVSLGDHLAEFIETQVKSGRYATASDVVRAGLRLLELRENELAWLKAQLAVAEDHIQRGELVDDSDEHWDELDRKAGERAPRLTKASAHVA